MLLTFGIRLPSCRCHLRCCESSRKAAGCESPAWQCRVARKKRRRVPQGRTFFSIIQMPIVNGALKPPRFFGKSCIELTEPLSERSHHRSRRGREVLSAARRNAHPGRGHDQSRHRNGQDRCSARPLGMREVDAAAHSDWSLPAIIGNCLLYTSDAADE